VALTVACFYARHLQLPMGFLKPGSFCKTVFFRF